MIIPYEDKTGVKRFMTCLEEHSISPLVRELEVSTHTASAAADALGCEISQIVKSLVFITLTTRRPVLVLVSGANKADPLRLSEILGEKVRLANEQAVFEITNYPVGAVPPAGFEPPLFTLIDEALAHHEILWTSGGSNHTQVAISYRDLCLITGGKVTTISHPLAIPVTVVPYDPEWPDRFKKEKK